MLPVDAGETFGHDVRVTDGALDALVAEQLLHVADARAVFEQMSSRRVPDRMRRDFLLVHVESPEKCAEAFADTTACNMPPFRRTAVADKNPRLK